MNISTIGLEETCEVKLIDQQELFVYGDNYTGYHWDYVSPLPSVKEVNLFHKNTTYNYQEICFNTNNHFPMTNIFLTLTYLIYSLAVFTLSIIKINDSMNK